jgi:hypothetical protein
MSSAAVALALDARDKKRAVMEAILASLPADAQRAFVNFYGNNQHSSQAIEGTSLTESEFRSLRDEVRRKYHAATSGPLTPEEWLEREQRLTARLNEIAQRRCVTGAEILQVIREREALFLPGGAR